MRSFSQKMLPFVFSLGLLFFGSMVIPHSAQAKPTWISDPASFYPSDRFLFGIGEADSRSLAESIALNNISKQFEVTVHSAESDFTQVLIAQQQTSNSQKIERHISTQSDMLLEGARIQNYWQDEYLKTHFVLAVLDKKEAEQRYLTRIKELNQRATSYYTNSQKGPNIVSVLSSAQQAQKTLYERDILQKKLSVVSSIQAPISLTFSQLNEFLSLKIASYKIFVKSDDESLRDIFSSASGKVGLSLSQQTSTVIEPSIAYTPIFQKNGWFWLRANLTVQIKENGKNIGQKVWDIKSSARIEADLKPRLIQSIDEQSVSYLVELLSDGHSL